MRDPDLERDCPGLQNAHYTVVSPRDVSYNCVAFAVGDTRHNWYDDRNAPGYYWPPGAGSADTLEGWISVFTYHGYRKTADSGFEPDHEKIAIYASPEGPEHVARQKASGVWISKMGKGCDIEHATLEALEGARMGRIVKIMKRPCLEGRRVLE